MRVISMQSKEVWNILQRNKIYEADIEKTRELHDYTQDILQLDGKVPIWCYAYPIIDFVTICTGEMLEDLRCEMSLGQEGCWDNFLLLEIEIPITSLHKGMAHNASAWCQVFGVLTFDMIRAVYRVRDMESEGWYYKSLANIYCDNPTDCITSFTVNTNYWDHHDNTAPSQYFTIGDCAECLQCKAKTHNMYKGKHLCSIKCARKHVASFARLARKPLQQADAYIYAIDADFEQGIRNFCNNLE